MMATQLEPVRHETGDETTGPVESEFDVTHREERWIEATLWSLPCLRTYPREKLGVTVDRTHHTTVLRLELPRQLDSAAVTLACRWARIAAIDFDPDRPVDIGTVAYLHVPLSAP